MDEPSLKQKIDELYEKEHPKDKKKEYKLGRKGRLSKGKLKRGYTIVMRIDDNKNVDFEKQPIQDSTVKLNAGDYHAVDEKDILFYKGKPLIIQAVKKENPYNPLDGTNKTYGQKYIKARLLADVIKSKGKGASWIIWIIIIGAILFGINYISKNGFNLHF